MSFSYRNLLDVLVIAMFEALECFGLEPVTDWMFYRGDMSFMIRGHEILLRSGDDPNKLRGLNLNYFGLDEAREFKDITVFNVLIGRLRKGELDQWAISSTSMGKNWFWSIAQSEGLEESFNCGYGANNSLTVIVQSSWENSFLPIAYLAELEKRYSDQLAQQELYGRIVDFSAGIFKRQWFDNKAKYFKATSGVRYWDLAATVNTWSDYTAGVLMTKSGGLFIITDVIRVKTLNLLELIVETAISDGTGIIVAIESVAMQAALVGIIMADPRMARFRVVPHNPDKDKFARALPLTSRFEQGLMQIVEASWNTDFIDEMCSFTPAQKGHDDECDAASGAFYMLNRDPAIRVPPVGTFPWPDPKNPEETKLVQWIVVVELKDYVAHVVGARYHPYRGELEIVSVARYTAIAELSKALKPYHKRFGTSDLEADTYKSISVSLAKENANVITGKLGIDSALYEFNKMADAHKVFVREGCVALAELSGADRDNFSPAVKCVLRMAQEIRVINREIPKPESTFEKSRRVYKDKQLQTSIKKDGWV